MGQPLVGAQAGTKDRKEIIHNLNSANLLSVLSPLLGTHKGLPLPEMANFFDSLIAVETQNLGEASHRSLPRNRRKLIIKN